MMLNQYVFISMILPTRKKLVELLSSGIVIVLGVDNEKRAVGISNDFYTNETAEYLSTVFTDFQHLSVPQGSDRKLVIYSREINTRPSYKINGIPQY